MPKQFLIAPDKIAAIAHTAVREYCFLIMHDDSHKPWNVETDAQKASLVAGVLKVMEGRTPEELHQAWMDYKIIEGYTLGPEKDHEKKTHPNLKPYNELSDTQKVKDALFQGVVKAFIVDTDPKIQDFGTLTIPVSAVIEKMSESKRSF